jgi:hypothetical protein
MNSMCYKLTGVNQKCFAEFTVYEHFMLNLFRSSDKCNSVLSCSVLLPFEIYTANS